MIYTVNYYFRWIMNVNQTSTGNQSLQGFCINRTTAQQYYSPVKGKLMQRGAQAYRVSMVAGDPRFNFKVETIGKRTIFNIVKL